MRIALLIACVLFCVRSNAQDSLRRKSFFKLSAVSVQGGVPGDNTQEVNKETISKVYTGFGSSPYSSYTSWSGWGIANNNVMFGAHLILDNYLRKKKRFSDQCQTLVGISFSHEQRMFYSVSDLQYRRKDTLYSSTGPPPLYRDEVVVKNAAIAYVVSSLGVDVQQLLGTNQQRILSFYAGLGSSLQFSVRSEIITQNRDIGGFFITTDPNYNYQLNTANGYVQSHLQQNTTETGSARHAGPQAFLCKFYIPMGVSIRLSAHPEKTLNKVSIFFQLRVGRDYLKVNGISGGSYGYSCISGGVKCKF